MAAEISIELFDGDAAFERLRDDWKALFARSNAAPFSSFEWTAAWFAFFGANRSPFVLAARRGGEIVAILPLCFERAKVLKMPLAKLTFLGAETGGAAYLDAVCLPDEKAAALQAFQKYFETQTNFDVLELTGVAADSALARVLQNDFDKRKFRRQIAPLDVCQFCQARGDADTILKNIYNDTAKKKLRRLKKLPGFEFRRVAAPDAVNFAFERFARLHDGNWTDKGGSDITGHRFLLDFHRRVVNDCKNSETLFFDELWAEDKCLAALYGFVRGRTYYYYSSGFDAAYAKFSPMATLYNLSIENGLRNGIEVFDFLRGGQDYKKHWTNAENRLLTVRLSRKNWLTAIADNSAALQSKLRELVIRLLPPETLENLKTRRRKRKRDSLPALWENGLND